MNNRWGPPVDGYHEAWCVIFSCILALVFIMAVYIALHICACFRLGAKDDSSGFFRSIGSMKALLLKPEVTTSDMDKMLKGFNTLLAGPGKGAEGGTLKRDSFTLEFKEKLSYLQGFIAVLKDGGKPLKQNDVRVAEVRGKIESISKRALALSVNDGFFWVIGFKRWLEIVFWGEFGVLVGIMAWVSVQVEKGEYSALFFKKEKLWYWTEVFIGPVVVIAVFFLLKQMVGGIIKGVTEEDVRGSIYLTLGISFTLGLYIRRSLGVFSKIKTKLFPFPKENTAKQDQTANKQGQ